MGRYVKTRIVTDGLIYLNDAGNSKSYSGVGTAIKNLVGYGATNTSFNQTFVSSGTTSYFESTNSSSYISNTNVSVSASTGRGFTICMMIKPQTLTNSEWNYWFQQQSETSWVEFGRYGTSNGWEIKDNIKIEGQKVFTSVGTTTWTVPVGVTSITAICIGGGGGGGGFGPNDAAGGGGGGGVSYGTNISVTPGETLYIRVGAGGSGGTSYNANVIPLKNETAGTSGESSYIKTGSHSGTALLEGGGGGGGGFGTFSGAAGGSGGTSSGTSRTGGTAGGNGGNGTSTRGGGGGGAGGFGSFAGGNGGSGTTATFGGTAFDGAASGGGNSSISLSDEVRNYGGGTGIYDGFRSSVISGGASNSNGLTGNGGLSGNSSTSSQRSVAGRYGGGGGTKIDTSTNTYIRDGGDGGQGAVRIVWGPGRDFNTANTVPSNIPVTQSTSFSDWTFVVCGVTTNYYTFISTNGSTKTLGSSNDWSTAPQINLDKIFGTGTSNYSCLWNNCMIYNRELTNEEIQINFEAFGRKFNL